MRKKPKGQTQKREFQNLNLPDFSKEFDETTEQSYNPHMKALNTAIYYGQDFQTKGGPIQSFMERVQQDIRHQEEMYGPYPNELWWSGQTQPIVTERLLAWAKRTGRWNDLPDTLQQKCEKKR